MKVWSSFLKKFSARDYTDILIIGNVGCSEVRKLIPVHFFLFSCAGGQPIVPVLVKGLTTKCRALGISSDGEESSTADG